jgi:type I restriction enzyme, S subunit
MVEWRTMSLEDAGVSLIDCVHATPESVEYGYPYIAIPQMKNGRIDFKDARRISQSDFIEWTKKARPQLHDIVLSRRTNPGVTATFGSQCDFALGQNLVLLRANGISVLPEFLRWLTVSPAWWLQTEKFNNVGAIFDSLKCADVPKFELPIPPKEDQRKISRVLSALDNKIELNWRMNETLETMAQAIFKDWFLDFGPVRAKAEGRVPYLAPEFWSLFPDRLDDEDKPEGWASVAVGDVVEFNPPERLPKGELAPYLDMAALPTSGPWPNQPIEREFASGSKFRNGDTLLARITPCLENGKTAYIDCLANDAVAWGSTEFIVLRPTPPFPPEYGYLLARHDAFRQHAIQSMTGTSGRQRVQTASLADYAVARPNSRIMEAFGDLVRPWFDMMRENARQSATLAETRDYLLPKLMSGEIRVRDAETIVEQRA